MIGELATILYLPVVATSTDWSWALSTVLNLMPVNRVGIEDSAKFDRIIIISTKALRKAPHFTQNNHLLAFVYFFSPIPSSMLGHDGVVGEQLQGVQRGCYAPLSHCLPQLQPRSRVFQYMHTWIIGESQCWWRTLNQMSRRQAGQGPCVSNTGNPSRYLRARMNSGGRRCSPNALIGGVLSQSPAWFKVSDSSLALSLSSSSPTMFINCRCCSNCSEEEGNFWQCQAAPQENKFCVRVFEEG